jgi:hypothetical protein
MAALECSGGDGMRRQGVNRASSASDKDWAARALEEDEESRRRSWAGLGWASLAFLSVFQAVGSVDFGIDFSGTIRVRLFSGNDPSVLMSACSFSRAHFGLPPC